MVYTKVNLVGRANMDKFIRQLAQRASERCVFHVAQEPNSLG